MGSIAFPLRQTGPVCPCCGAAASLEDFFADLNSNQVSYRGKTIRLEPNVVEFLFILSMSYPSVVYRDRIIMKMYGLAEGPNANNNINVLCYKARKVGKMLGFEIATSALVGYQLRLNK